VIDKKLIGRGRTGEVYEWEENRILKLFYSTFPAGGVKQESDIGALLNESGINAPVCYGPVSVDGRNGIVYQKIEGISLLRLIEKSPWRIVEYSKHLARLHHDLHQVSFDKLPSQKKSMGYAMGVAKDKLGAHYQPLTEQMALIEGGTAICHGDFHPDNILVNRDASIIIDWMTAVSGNPMADVARSWLIFKSPYIPEHSPLYVRLLSKLLKSIIARAYLGEYLKLSGISFQAVKTWMPLVAAARLFENVPGEEKWLLGIIERSSRERQRSKV